MQHKAYYTMAKWHCFTSTETEVFGKLQLLFSQHEQTSMMKTIEDDSAKMQILILMHTIYLPPPVT